MLYAFLVVLLVDVTRLFNSFLHFLPAKETVMYQKLKIYTLLTALTFIIGLISYGVWNAAHPVTKRLDITIDKNAGTRRELSVVLVTDIHMGSLFGKHRIEKMVNAINTIHPDIVLFAGDILDEVQDPIIRENMGEPIKKLYAPLGIYGITGNHEYIGGIANSVKYIESLGIKLLRDTTLLIENSFWLAGREDRDINRFTGNHRKTLENVLSGVNHNQPIILMDHQPFALDISEKNGVDLQVSGHTHHGQMWPLNYITNKIYEVSWGYKKKGNTHIYVSCGYGLWGPQVRIGSRPEMVNIKIKFK
jgi:predicted MPP superfamily phosphohydrolase